MLVHARAHSVLSRQPDLAGVWGGTYGSRETGRSGTAYLALTADGDSAAAEVGMVPRERIVAVRRSGEGWLWQGVAPAHVLTTRLVRSTRGAVGADLNPYRDPDCGCLWRTTFRGSVEGDTVEGTFVTEAEPPGHDAEGTWRAARRRAP